MEAVKCYRWSKHEMDCTWAANLAGYSQKTRTRKPAVNREIHFNLRDAHQVLEKSEILRQEAEEEHEASSNEVFGPEGGGDGPTVVFAEQDRRRCFGLEEVEVPGTQCTR